MESLAKLAQIEKIKEDKVFVEFTFKEKIKVDTAKLFKTAYKLNDRFTFKYIGNRVIMTLNGDTENKEWINTIITLLEQYMK